jgi:hypothetical protein
MVMRRFDRRIELPDPLLAAERASVSLKAA